MPPKLGKSRISGPANSTLSIGSVPPAIPPISPDEWKRYVERITSKMVNSPKASIASIASAAAAAAPNASKASKASAAAPNASKASKASAAPRASAATASKASAVAPTGQAYGILIYKENMPGYNPKTHGKSITFMPGGMKGDLSAAVIKPRIVYESQITLSKKGWETEREYNFIRGRTKEDIHVYYKDETGRPRLLTYPGRSTVVRLVKDSSKGPTQYYCEIESPPNTSVVHVDYDMPNETDGLDNRDYYKITEMLVVKKGDKKIYDPTSSDTAWKDAVKDYLKEKKINRAVKEALAARAAEAVAGAGGPSKAKAKSNAVKAVEADEAVAVAGAGGPSKAKAVKAVEASKPRISGPVEGPPVKSVLNTAVNASGLAEKYVLSQMSLQGNTYPGNIDTYIFTPSDINPLEFKQGEKYDIYYYTIDDVKVKIPGDNKDYIHKKGARLYIDNNDIKAYFMDPPTIDTKTKGGRRTTLSAKRKSRNKSRRR